MKPARLATVERRLSRERAYWLGALAGEPAATLLTPDFDRPARYDGVKQTMAVPIDEGTAVRVCEVARREPALVLAALTAAAGACLAKYNGATDIVVGTPVRSAFNDVVPVRFAIVGEMTSRELMTSVRVALAGAFRHSKYPFDRLVELLGLERPANRTPLIGLTVELEVGVQTPTFNSELEVGVRTPTFNSDLMTDVRICGLLEAGRLAVRLDYDPRLFLPPTMETFAAHFARTLTQLVARPDARLADLPLMTADERREAIDGFNDTAADYPRDSSIHSLIEAQADRTPEAVAVRCGSRTLTYRDLDHRANRLAQTLRSRGIGAGARVAILLPHSEETVVSILGILKSGAAYVPLDPDHPRVRLDATLADAQVAATIRVDDLIADASAPAERIGVDGSPADTAYVIYTSGSTGTPKGVAIAHRSLVNYIWWAARSYAESPARPIDAALHSSLAFDLTVTSIFVPLVTGGTIVAYPATDDEPPIVEVLRDDRVALVKLTPSHLALVAEQTAIPSRLRTLIVGGEQLDTALARRIHHQFAGHVAIFNEYGPTETTVGCMIHRFDPAADRRSAVPIGVPAANMRIYVLDSRLEPVVPNAVGELYIGGDGVAQGYLGQSAMTAERFVGDPFRAGAMMYRTGDLARRLPDGPIAFLGRNDDQVKVRGHRIDLNEVRHALTSHPLIRDCAIRRLDDPAGGSAIVAYYVSRQPIDTAELRAFLRDRLVAAAVPSAFAFLRRLPLTLNGKVNVRALPALDDIRRQTARASEPPRTATEQAVAGIWQRLLHADRVGAHDNFFELGGHSLVATQVVSRVRDTLGVELPLRSLFEHPTVAGLAARIDALGAELAQAARIPAAPRDCPLPLSFAQQRLWFLDQLEPGSVTYNIAARLHIDGDLDVDAFRAGIQAIVARHESLRTTFADEDGRPTQRIADRLALDVPLIDLSGLDERARATAVDHAAAAEARLPFDLRIGPLIRVQLLRLGADRHVLLLTLHHIIADGWSLRVLARELSVTYAAGVAGATPAFAALPIQYADFAVWQRGILDGERLAADLAFWRETLDGVPVIELPTDRPRPAVQTFHGASLPIALAAGVTAGVRRVSRDCDATPFMTLLAAYAALLHRSNGQHDLAIGSPIANRTQPETEGVIGFFANTLVLRIDTSGQASFRELVRRVKSVVLDASAHQDMPFERLVEELQPDRTLSHNPLFQVMFGLHPASVTALALPGLRFESRAADTGTAKFDLNILLDDDGDRVAGAIEYNTDLFDETTIARLREHFETFVAAAIADPDASIDDLPVMAAREEQLVTRGWNDTHADAGDRCLHELVETIAARAPDRIAVVFPGDPDRTLTYAELNASANRLAHHLRAHGVGPDVPVGLCLERSIEMAVAVLAVLKAGGAYVPMDPEYPRERLRQMMDDARAPVLVAHAATRDRLPESDAARIVWLDADRAAIEAHPDTKPASGVTLDNLLYVIYTSGSTGRPKGIALSHRALANLIAWNLSTPLAVGAGVLQFASLSFDASFHEMFAAWGSGRHLAMIPEAWRRDPSELMAYLERWPCETVILPVVVLHHWAEWDRGGSNALRAITNLVTTGEQLVITQPIVELFERLPGCTLHNHYGPSETHVVTALTLDRDPRTWPSRPSIGRPIANSCIFVLDARLNPAPIGVAGELYIGGTNLARGYLNRSDLTAAKFVPHPFPSQPGERLYATGDLARWQADGTIEFLGRRDDQVKIRGFRVELGDVESSLNRHPDVGQSVVVVHGHDNHRRIVAYAVPKAGRTLTVDRLRAFAQRELPEYMVPATFVVLEALALTQNGKVDTRALPPPPDDRLDLSLAYVEPDGPAEELMVEIWKALLGLERVGARDSFFHLGGHSLLATQLVSRIRAAFEIALPLKAVFESPTPAGLVDALARVAGNRNIVDEIAWAVREVDRLSPEEVRTLLDETSSSEPAGSAG